MHCGGIKVEPKVVLGLFIRYTLVQMENFKPCYRRIKSF